MNVDYCDLSRNLILQRQEAMGGIGTLGEKTVHSTLKQYLSGDLAYQEIKIGSYYADVCIDGHIFEIQTRQFNKLRSKLDFFLKDHPVTVVFPVTNTNYLRWVTPDTGEITPPKKSTRRGNPLQVFAELYRIRSFLSHPNFSLKIVPHSLYNLDILHLELSTFFHIHLPQPSRLLLFDKIKGAYWTQNKTKIELG